MTTNPPQPDRRRYHDDPDFHACTYTIFQRLMSEFRGLDPTWTLDTAMLIAQDLDPRPLTERP